VNLVRMGASKPWRCKWVKTGGEKNKVSRDLSVQAVGKEPSIKLLTCGKGGGGGKKTSSPCPSIRSHRGECQQGKKDLFDRGQCTTTSRGEGQKYSDRPWKGTKSASFRRKGNHFEDRKAGQYHSGEPGEPVSYEGGVCRDGVKKNMTRVSGRIRRSNLGGTIRNSREVKGANEMHKV